MRLSLSLTGLLFACATATAIASTSPIEDNSSSLMKRTGGYQYCSNSNQVLVFKNGQCQCNPSKPSGWSLCKGPTTAGSGQAVCNAGGCNIICNGSNSVIKNNDCQCKAGFTRKNGQCVPTCGQYESYDSRTGQCACQPSCSRNKRNNNQCEPSCGENEEYKNGECKCVSNFEKSGSKCQIKCDIQQHQVRKNSEECKCADGFKFNSNGKCKAICTGENEFYSNGQCKCSEGFTKKDGCCKAICTGKNEEFKNGRCQCEGGFIRNNDGKCKVPQCGNNMEWNGSRCVCKPGCNSHPGGNSCSPPQCRTNEEYKPSKNRCECKDGFERTLFGFCVPSHPECPKNEHWNGESCVCIPGCWRNKNSKCEPPTPSHRPAQPPAHGNKNKGKFNGVYPIWSKKHHTREEDSHFCPDSLSACPIPSLEGGYECVDTSQELENCGGCSIDGDGKDCTQIQGVSGVGCLSGKCVIFSCNEGYRLSTAGVCIPSIVFRSL